MPLISAGFELQNVVLKSWEKALKAVLDEYLGRAYDRATENWDWVDGKAFTPDAIHQAYTLLIVEDRQRAEADKRNAARRNKDTYRCHHCQDVGYQPLYAYQQQRWYSSLRPCCCDATPLNQRQQFPLDEAEWVRGKAGEYARRTDIEKYGVPNKDFTDVITSN